VPTSTSLVTQSSKTILSINNFFPSAPQEFKVGDKAPLAHQDTRKFPEWYKPYQFNYFSDGYMLLGFFIMALFGYSYFNDICQMKGRKQRKVFESQLPTQIERTRKQRNFIHRRLEAHDAHIEKFMHPKERAAAHH
jgi:hypothetical protein